MACCTNKLIWRSMVSVPPDITPPDEETIGYLYNVFIRGDLYDIFNDTYDSITVDGVTYSSTGGSLNDGGAGPNFATSVFPVDAISAGLGDGINNDYNYLAYDSSYGITSNNYVFTFVTSEPHVISINLTLNGNPVSIPLQGGAYSMTNYCVTTNIVDASTQNAYYIDMYDEVGGISQYYIYSPAITQDAVILSTLNSFLNTVTSFLIPYNVTYTDNGNGTYTHLMTVPTINITPNNITGDDIGFNVPYTPC